MPGTFAFRDTGFVKVAADDLSGVVICDAKKGNVMQGGAEVSTARGLLNLAGRPSLGHSQRQHDRDQRPILLNNGRLPVKIQVNSQRVLFAGRGHGLPMVVLSIGMLGIAALYVESLRSGTSALLRSQAVAFASDMADRIRANPTAGRVPIQKGSTTRRHGHRLPAPRRAPVHALSRRWPRPTSHSGLSNLDDRSDNPGLGRQGLPAGRGIIDVAAGPPAIYNDHGAVDRIRSGPPPATTC
jgi:hypothetical protein